MTGTQDTYVDWSMPVDTTGGRVRGRRVSDGYAFRGIPYGADTGGLNRFMPPQKPTPWIGIRDTAHFGHRAPQHDRPYPAAFDWLFSTHHASEDCLVLNVYTPATDGARRPVMVWFHGGAFAFGSSDVPVLDGCALSNRGDLVVVTVNHRLNAFGYIAPPGNDPRFADSGNAGMLDLVLALEWVRDNIAGFGGNPDCVTIFGQSGGGAKVATLMGMAVARGLFHRAICQSPSSGFRLQAVEDASDFRDALLGQLQLGPHDFPRLQTVPTGKLLAAQQQVVAAHGGADFFRPMIDGRSLTEHPFYPAGPAGAEDIPLMMGSAATEATFYLASDPENHALSMNQVHARIRRFMKIDDHATKEILAEYAENHPYASPSDLLVHVASDHMYRLTALEGAQQKVRQGRASVFLYRFAWRSPAFGGFIRSPHTAEIPFIFGHVAMARKFTGDSEEARWLMHRCMDAWANFARHGDPNGVGLAPWQPLSLGKYETFVFDAPECRMEEDPAGADRIAMARYPRFSAGSVLNFRTD